MVLHVIIQKIYYFLEKSELPKFIHLVKISWLMFSANLRDGNENFAEIKAGSLSCLAPPTPPHDFTLTGYWLLIHVTHR